MESTKHTSDLNVGPAETCKRTVYTFTLAAASSCVQAKTEKHDSGEKDQEVLLRVMRGPIIRLRFQGFVRIPD